jgi:hypothetical protein
LVADDPVFMVEVILDATDIIIGSVINTITSPRQ